MMKAFFSYSLLLLAVSGWVTPPCLAQLAPATSAPDDAPSEEEIAINKILKSERWTQAMQQFDQWIAIQSIYDEAEVVALRSELRNRVAMMSPAQLQTFLEEMESRLAVLLSPAAMDARRWVAPLTDQALQRTRARFGVEDPLQMSAEELDDALAQFAVFRQSQASGAAAFNQASQSAANVARSANQAQRQASNQAAQRRAATFQSQAPSYAPRPAERTPRTFTRKYPGSTYSISPWGGVWVTPRQ